MAALITGLVVLVLALEAGLVVSSIAALASSSEELINLLFSPVNGAFPQVYACFSTDLALICRSSSRFLGNRAFVSPHP
jgi:hypothetical protein